MIVVDHSILRSVATCELHAWLRHVAGWTGAEANASLLAGTAAHAALAVWFEHPDAGAALSVFENAYRAWAEEHVSTHIVLNWPNTRDVMRHWFERVGPALGWRVRAIEERCEYELAAGILYRQRIDLRIQDPLSDADAIVDHKTSQRLGEAWATQWSLDAQMTGYVWRERPAVRFYINGIEWSRLPISGRTCKVHGTPFTTCRLAHANTRVVGPYKRTDEQIHTWKRNAEHLASRFAALRETALRDVTFAGEHTGACSRCEFQSWCSLGRHEEQLERLLIQDPWMPGGAPD